jgi:uncharacterized protein with HEPN domain
VPPREWRLRIENILDAATRIARYIEGKGLAAFAGDDLTQDAVSRCFGIIREAISLSTHMVCATFLAKC